MPQNHSYVEDLRIKIKWKCIKSKHDNVQHINTKHFYKSYKISEKKNGGISNLVLEKKAFLYKR